MGLLIAGGVTYLKFKPSNQTPTPTPSAIVIESPSPSPTPTLTSSPLPSSTVKPATASGKMISCKGPDGKISQKTQQDCDAFNKAWGTPTPQPTQNNSSSNSSNQPSNNTSNNSSTSAPTATSTPAPTTGTITGTIKDSAGNPIAYASFRLTCTDGCLKLRNGYSQSEQADGSGNFTVADLPISTNITATPFSGHWGTAQAFSLEPGQTLTLNLVVN